MLYVPLGLVLIATVCDLRNRTIPDWISGLVLGWAVAATTFGLNDVSWLSLLGGFVFGLLAGLVLFALQGLGGGDVKLLAALGAVLGVEDFPALLLLIALAGGVLGLVAALRGKRDLAYAPAIALGFLLFLAWREGWAHVLAS